MIKDKSKLVAKQELVQRGGKVYTTTVYVDPNKIQPLQSKVSHKVQPPARKYTGTKRLDHATLRRGDKVTLTYQGQVVTGEFRHIAVTPRYPAGKAVLAVHLAGDTKLVERNLDEVTPLVSEVIGKEQQFARLTTAADYSLGDSVKFSTRQRSEDGTPYTTEVTGTLARFKGEPDAKGQLVHIKLDNGEIKERYLHNVTRYNAQIDPLTPTQAGVVNGAINSLRNSNKADFDLISVFSGKRGNLARVAELNNSINERNADIKKHLQVLRRELPFEHIVEDVQGIGEDGEDEHGKYRMTLLGKLYKMAPAPKVEKVTREKEERYVKPELTEAEVHELQLTTYRANIGRALNNMKNDAGKTDYPAQLQHYRSTRNFQLGMLDMIAYKELHGFELSDPEKKYAANPPALPVKPVAPTPDPALVTVSTPLTRTVTTVSNNVKRRQLEATNADKRKELTDLIAKTEALDLTPATADKLLARYREKLAKLGPAKVRATRGANTKSILADLLKINNGQAAAGFKINERIMALDAPATVKQSLKTKFSESIRAGILKRKAAEKEVESALRNRPAIYDDSEDLEKSVIVPESVFDHFAKNFFLKAGAVTLVSKDMYAALNAKFNLDKQHPNARVHKISNLAGQLREIVIY